MKFYEFGNTEAPVLLLLPGTCCHWRRNFGQVIDLLKADFHIVCVSYDGFDEREQTIFPDMLTETEKIERFIQDSFGGRIAAAYGCSLGGSFAGLLLQRRRVHIDHVILGSSDLDQEEGLSARFKAWLIAKVLHGVMGRGKLPGWMQKRLRQKSPEDRAYMEQMLGMMGLLDGSMTFVQRQSIRNQFYSDLVTPLEDGIAVPGSNVHCFYAEKMGECYLERYRQHFKAPHIVKHPLNHEELLLCQPEKWAQEVKRCLSGKRSGV